MNNIYHDNGFWDAVQYEAFSANRDISYHDWIRLTIDWVDGIADINPYPLDDKEASKRILEKLH